jgi:hypothetical protein
MQGHLQKHPQPEQMFQFYLKTEKLDALHIHLARQQFTILASDRFEVVWVWF